MSDLHPDLVEAQKILAESGIRVVRQGSRLVQYAPGIVGLYSMVTVQRTYDGRLHVDGRTPDRAREVLAEHGYRVCNLRTAAN